MASNLTWIDLTMSSYSRKSDDRYSSSRYADRSRSRSRSPKSEGRRSKDRPRKSRWHREEDDNRRDRERRDYHDNDRRDDDRRTNRGSRRSRFTDRESEEDSSRVHEREWDRGKVSARRSEGSDRYQGELGEDVESCSTKQLSSISPGPILMFRNLTSSILKEHLTQALGYQMSYIKDIRLINGREGLSNYAFIEFYTTDDAVNWMEANKNGFEVRGCHVNVDFSHHRSIDGGDKRKKEFKWSDWNCFKCGTLNFSRRTVCLTCDCNRAESDSLHEDRRAGLIPELEGEEDSSKINPPSNVLIFRGLDGLSTEETITQAISDVSDIAIKDVRLIRDKSTNTSRRFCFVETITTEEAAELNRVLQEQHPAFFVDGRRIIVSYARLNAALPKPANSVAAAAIQQAQAMNMGPSSWQSKQQQHCVQKNTSNATESVTATQEQVATTTGLPSTYLYDSTSGFYYDTITGLYYDPKTQYHYNSHTGQYCYYDSTSQAYIPVTADGTPVVAAETSGDMSKDIKKNDVTVAASGGINAKKIAKDMERWAKSVNTQKVVQQQVVNQLIQQQIPELQPNIPQPITEPNELPVSFGMQQEVSNDKPSLYVQAAEEDTPIMGGDMEFADMTQLACLLCKRKFNSKEQLMKHIQLSDLHKQNLEKLKSQSSQSETSIADQMLYRDRAKERRAKYGTDAIVPGWKKRFERERARTAEDEPVPVLDTPQEVETENVGTKMLKAMGWNEGQGLGKEGQGITKPIEAEKRTPSAGLGIPGSSYGAVYSAGNDYRATLKSLTKARYDQTF